MLLKYSLSLLANDIWRYTPDKNYWEEDVPSDNTKPEGRYYHSMGSSSNSVYIFGGDNGKDLLKSNFFFM